MAATGRSLRLVLAPAAEPGTAWRQVWKASNGFSSPSWCQQRLRTAKERNGEGGSTLLLQTHGCCDHCTKRRAESGAALHCRLSACRKLSASAGAQTCCVGTQRLGDANGVNSKNDEGWILLFIHLPRGLYFQAF